MSSPVNIPQQTVPMFAPDGTLGDIPAEKLRDALNAGFKQGVTMKTADGKLGVIPADRVQEAAKSGLQIVPLGGQDTQHPGFWKSLGSDVYDMAKGAISPRNILLNAATLGLGSSVQAVSQFKNAAQHSDEQKAAGRGLAYRLATPVAEGLGVNVRGMEQAAQQGDSAGVLGHAAAVPTVMAATAGIAKAAPVVADALPTAEGLKVAASKTPILKTFVDGPPPDMLTRAIKPGKNNTGWTPAIQKAIPDMKAAEAYLGKPIASVDDALEAATIAKKKLWNQYEQKLGPASQMGAQIDGNAIADAMVKSVDNRTALQNPNLLKRVTAQADTYRRPLTVTEAEDFLQSANRDLNSYYAKNKVGRQVAENDPETASTVAEAEMLRQQLYAKLNQVSGPGAFELKQRYGALSNVENELAGRKNVMARQQPNSLAEQISTARGAGKIAKGVFTLSPGDVLEGSESIATSRWLKERNSTDAMIQRAFAATPIPESVAINTPMTQIRGLLPRGPIVTPSPADTSGSVPYTPPPVENTTRAQRLGLLLPEKTGGTPLQPSSLDEAMQILNAKSRVIRDPRTGKMRRQYLTSGN